MKKLSLLGLLFLSSCTFSKPVNLPDGSQGYTISCGGTLNSMSTCFQKAGELCGGSGYEIYDQNQEQHPFLIGSSNANGSMVGNPRMIVGNYSENSSINAGHFVNRHLMVKCKPNKAK